MSHKIWKSHLSSKPEKLITLTYVTLLFNKSHSGLNEVPILKHFGKKGPYGPELIWHFGIQLAKNIQLSLSGQYAKANEV